MHRRILIFFRCRYKRINFFVPPSPDLYWRSGAVSVSNIYGDNSTEIFSCNDLCYQEAAYENQYQKQEVFHEVTTSKSLL